MNKLVIFNEIIELKNYIRDNENIFLYGAGALAQKIILISDVMGYKKHISQVVVSKNRENRDSFFEIPVNDNIKELDGASVLIGTVDYRNEIVKRLNNVKCNCFAVSDVLGNELLKGVGFSNDKYLESVVSILIDSKENDKKDIVFFTPPYWDAFSPFSAVPCLVAALKKNGFSTKQYDLGIACVNNTLDREWSGLKNKILSKEYYTEYVVSYQRNMYSTYESYFESVNAILGEKYNLSEIKEKYILLDDTQRAAVDGIFEMAEWFGIKNIDFEHCQDIDVDISKCYDKSFFDCLSSDFFRSAVEHIDRVVGISITSIGQFIYGCLIAKIIKRIKPKAKIVLGGSCVDVFLKSGYGNKKDILNYFDYVIVGEGETAIVELVKAILYDTDKDGIPNLAKFDGASCVLPPVFLEDVESLEPPDYDDLDLSEYLSTKDLLAYQSSRGCHYGYCAFCNHDDKYRHNYRTKTSQKIISDLLFLQKKYNVDCFQFVDEAIRPDCFKNMVDEMDDHDEFKRIKWFYYSRVSYKYTKEVLQKAKRNGCEMVMFGVETLNQRLLNFIKKGITVGASIYSLKLFHECGIKTFSWLMTNLPSETIEEAKKDLDDVKKLSEHIDAMDVGPFMLVRNTDMYHNLEKFNITKKHPEDATRFESHYDGVVINKDEMLSFFRNKYLPYVKSVNLNVSRYTLFFRKN